MKHYFRLQSISLTDTLIQTQLDRFENFQRSRIQATCEFGHVFFHFFKKLISDKLYAQRVILEPLKK